MGVGDSGGAAAAVGVGDGGWRRRWWWLEWKHCLFVDNDKSSIGICRRSFTGG